MSYSQINNLNVFINNIQLNFYADDPKDVQGNLQKASRFISEERPIRAFYFLNLIAQGAIPVNLLAEFERLQNEAIKENLTQHELDYCYDYVCKLMSYDRLQSAERFLLHLIDSKNNLDARFYVCLAEVFISDKKFEELAEFYEKYQLILPTKFAHSAIHTNTLQGKFEKVIQIYELNCEDSLENLLVTIEYVYAKINTQGDPQEIIDFTEALLSKYAEQLKENDLASSALYFCLGIAYERVEDYGKALTYYAFAWIKDAKNHALIKEKMIPILEIHSEVEIEELGIENIEKDHHFNFLCASFLKEYQHFEEAFIFCKQAYFYTNSINDPIFFPIRRLHAELKTITAHE